MSIPEQLIPRAKHPAFQHVLDTYASETNKTLAVWLALRGEDMSYRPHLRSSSVAEILKHQLLSERRFFAEFLGLSEPPGPSILPVEQTVDAYAGRLIELAAPRLDALAAADESWWLEAVPFFDVSRQRIWIFWRRVLHSAHHRTQLTVYLRLSGRPVPSTYGPTADVTWQGADPTQSVDAASRK